MYPASAEPVLLLAHLDVVETSPWDWSVHPFEFLDRLVGAYTSN